MRGIPPWFGSTLASAALLWVLGPHFAAGRPFVAVLSIFAWAALLGGVDSRASSIARFASAAAAGLSGAALWHSSPEAWARVSIAVAVRLALFPAARREVFTLSAPVVVPASLVAVTVVFGLDDARHALFQTVLLAARPLASLFVDATAITAAFWLSTRRMHESGGPVPRESAVPSLVCFAGLAFAAGVRSRLTFAEVLAPCERQWAEAPLLLNVLKHSLGQPLYADFDRVDSFTYSPTFELLESALLSPFHASLRIGAHRALVLVWQWATASILTWALLPRLGGTTRSARFARAGCVFVAFLCVQWASPASPFLHPDHAVHLVVAVVAAGLLRCDRERSRAFRVGAALAPPIAAAFKLTGGGVGIGLALAALVERRRSMIAPLFIAAAASLAIIPAYDFAFGRFSDYAVRLMARHDVLWGRLPDVVSSSQGRLILLASALCIAAGSRTRAMPPLAAFMVGLGALTGLAFLKAGGRPNNLVAPALVAVFIIYLALSEGGAPRFVDVVAASALVAIGAGRLREPDVDGFQAMRSDYGAAVAFVRHELAADRNPLVHLGTTIWIAAGGKGVPKDQLVSAVELYLARDPAYERHLQRLASGLYGSIVTPGVTFVAESTVGGRFGDDMRRAVRDRYCQVYPMKADGTAMPAELASNRLVILKRRDLGCSPLTVSASDAQ